MRKLLVTSCLILLVAGGMALAQDAKGQEPGGVIMAGSVVEMFKNGGPLMWPILLCSIVALTFAFERLFGLRRSVVFPRKLLGQITALTRVGNAAEARELCASDKSVFARLLHACLARFDSPGYEMEAALEEAGARVLYDLRRNARALGVIADAAPLLGLMGTVLGMIKAFEEVARAGALGRTEMLAGGIGEALLTTAFGLGVAVPALVLYHFFRDKADGLLRAMEDACIDIVMDLRRQAGSDPKRRADLPEPPPAGEQSAGKREAGSVE